MILFIIFYLIVGILIAIDNNKADIREGYESDLYLYRWIPITWFFILLYNVLTDDEDELDV